MSGEASTNGTAVEAVEGAPASRKRSGGGHGPTKADLQRTIDRLRIDVGDAREALDGAYDRVRALETTAAVGVAARIAAEHERALAEKRPTFDEVRALVRKCFLRDGGGIDLNRVLTRARTITEIDIVVETAIETARLLGDANAEAAAKAEAVAKRNAPEPVPAPSSAEPRYRIFLTRVNGNFIGAIKAVREVSSLGLKEAKDLVDVVTSDLGAGQVEIPAGVFGARSLVAVERAKAILVAAGAEVRIEEIK